MPDKKSPVANPPAVKTETGLTPSRAKSLIELTDSALANKHGIVASDAWLDELIAWADENNIPDYQKNEYGFFISLPRNKQKILSLTELYFYSYQLSYLPNSFGNLVNLRTLSLNDNQLSTLPDSFGNLANLTYLFLSNNQLSALPNSFANLTNLEFADLHNNPIKQLPPSLAHMENIVKLW